MLYIYKLNEKGVKTAAGFTHAGKKWTVDANKRHEFRMETTVEHPAPSFMGLELIEVKE